MNLQQKDSKYLGRSGGRRPLLITKESGPYVFDEKGKRYIDFYMGSCVGNIGWNVPEVVKQVREFDGPTYVTPSFYYEGWVELAELLAEVTPGDLVKSYRATGGTEAVEIALQAAMSHTKRTKFISVEGSYHGHSIGALSIGSSEYRQWYSNLLPGCHKITPPLNAETGKKVEELLAKRDIAAFIAEPIICNLAVEIPDAEFFRIVRAACKKYGTVFVSDEVATGFGRTGKMFASEHYDLNPDILCLAKGLTGGFGGLGATIMTDEVANSFEFNFSYYSTFGWHPLSVVGTIENIKYLKAHKTVLMKNTQEQGEYILKRLRAMKFREAPEIRGKGLAIGMKFNNGDYPAEIVSRCLENGLLVENASGPDVVFFPALNIDRKTVDEGLAIFETCIQ